MASPKRRVVQVASEWISFESLFALFLFAGVYKEAPWLSWVPVDLTAAFLALSGLAGLGVLARGNRPHRDAVVLTGLFLAFVAYALLSLAWSPGGAYAREKALKLVATTLPALAGAAIIIAPDRRRIRRFLGATVALGGFAAAVTLLVAVGLTATTSSSYLTLARTVGLAGLVVLYEAIAGTSAFRRRASALGVVVAVTALSVAGGRAPFVAAIVVGVALASVLLLRRVRRSSTAKPEFVGGGLDAVRIRGIPSGTGGVVVVALTAAVAGVLFVAVVGLPRTIWRLLVISTSPESSFGRRLVLWVTAVREIPTAPLFGHGFGSWLAITPGAVIRYPHNMVFEVLVELGVVGGALLGAVVGYGLRSAGRTVRTGVRPRGLLVFALVAFLFINAAVTGDVNGNRYFFAYVGLLVAPSLGWPPGGLTDGLTSTR